MKFREILRDHGGPDRVYVKLGLKYTTVRSWYDNNWIPPKRWKLCMDKLGISFDELDSAYDYTMENKNSAIARRKRANEQV